MLISASFFLSSLFHVKSVKERKKRGRRKTRGERPLAREKDKGVGLGSAEAADGKQKNRGPYLKSTIEIQDPYANSAVGGRGKRSWKIGNEEKKERTLYRII